MIKISYILFFKVLSNNTRLRIIGLLKKGPRNATEIGEVLNIEQSMVSHNLACLINCGFVLVEQNGKNKICSLNKETVLPLLEIMDRHIKEYGKNLEGCEILKDVREAIKERLRWTKNNRPGRGLTHSMRRVSYGEV